eukprot:2916613-Rhodomonas_salina.1
MLWSSSPELMLAGDDCITGNAESVPGYVVDCCVTGGVLSDADVDAGVACLHTLERGIDVVDGMGYVPVLRGEQAHQLHALWK